MGEPPNIFRRLEGLKASGSLSAGGPYSVPGDYFDGFAAKVISRIVVNEGEELPPVLMNVSKSMPYAVRDGYFHPSVVAGNLRDASNEPVFKPTDGYFDQVTQKILDRIVRQKVPVLRNRGIRYGRFAAAAVVSGLIALATFFGMRDKIGRSQAEQDAADLVQQKIKIIDTDQLNSFLLDTALFRFNEGLSDGAATHLINFGQLLEKTPDKDLKLFLEETGGADDDFLQN